MPCATDPPAFYRWCVLGFKTPNFEEPALWGNAPFSGVDLPHQLFVVSFVPEKQSHACTVPGIYGVAQRKAATRFSTLCTCLCPLPIKGYLLSLAGSFVFGEAIYHLPNVLQEEEYSLPVLSRRSLYHFVCSYVNTLLPRSTCYSSFLSKVTYFQNLRV